jgi:hypothetical protein
LDVAPEFLLHVCDWHVAMSPDQRYQEGWPLLRDRACPKSNAPRNSNLYSSTEKTEASSLATQNHTVMEIFLTG